MSGYGRYQDRVRGREAGFDSYLVKPIDLAVLQSCSRVLRRSKPQTGFTGRRIARGPE